MFRIQDICCNYPSVSVEPVVSVVAALAVDIVEALVVELVVELVEADVDVGIVDVVEIVVAVDTVEEIDRLIVEDVVDKDLAEHSVVLDCLGTTLLYINRSYSHHMSSGYYNSNNSSPVLAAC